MDEGLLALLALMAAIAAAGAVRAAFLAASRHGAVDHYYWILAARAYRTRRGLPVRIAGKYLLEDERQAYPPGFGRFLAFFPDALLRSRRSVWLMVGLDAVTLAVLLAAGLALGLPLQGLAAIAAVLGLAPVLAAYNTQITSRGLGNLALVVSLLVQAAATASLGPIAAALWLLASLAAAAVILTHKMTTQLMLALWLPWTAALGSWQALLVPPAGLLIAMLSTGMAFQRLQWSAHAEIVSFWNRNWRFLGAHPFRQSPIYGDPQLPAPTAFHQPGLAGMVRHLALAFSYLPAGWLLPLTLAVAPAPAGWIIVWLGVALALALATLLVPPLKCLGAGHYYLFNAVAPAALWWGTILASPNPGLIALFAVAMALTGASLALGWHRRRLSAAEDALAPLIDRLAALPPRNVAVFPVTAAERIAFETPHAVFWGGHGLGFPRLEPYFPLFRERLGEAMRRHRIDLVVLDAAWWPEGSDIVHAELGPAAPEAHGGWLLFDLTRSAANAPRGDVPGEAA